MPTLPASFECEECRRLARALQAAWRADNRALSTRLREVAASSGQDLQRFKVNWLMSVASMPDDEMRGLLESHYPEVAKVKRKCEEHETATGHSLKGWRMFLQYAPEEPE